MHVNTLFVTSQSLMLLVSLTVLGQDPASQPPYLSTPPFAPANRWMTIPITWTPSTDAVSAVLRAQRDTSLDRLIGLSEPINIGNVRGSGLSEGVLMGDDPELPVLPNRALLIASFDSYQPVLSKTGRSIYTEVIFSIDTVFQSADSLMPGQKVTLILPGGTIKTASGDVLPFLTQPRQYFINPGRTYFLALSFHPAGNYFMLGRSWDLTDDLITQNFYRPKQFASLLNGLRKSDLFATLQRMLAQH